MLKNRGADLSESEILCNIEQCAFDKLVFVALGGKNILRSLDCLGYKCHIFKTPH